MDIIQITAVIGAAASLLCTLVVGALTFFIKRTLVNLEKSDEKNAAHIKEVEDKLGDLKSDLPLVYTLREDFVRSMNSVDRSVTGFDQKLDRVINMVATLRKEE